MKNAFIILGAIVALAFIIGIILVMNEKKRKKSEVLTDDPKILFEDNAESFHSSMIVDNEISAGGVNMTNVDSSLQNDVSVSGNKSTVDYSFDEEII